MSCSCAYAHEDCDDTATIWRESRVQRSRKEHHCYECGDPIPPGSRCCKAVSLCDGMWWTACRCVSCATYAEYISMEAKLCPLWGHLHDFVYDNELNLPTLTEWREREGRAAS